MYYILLVLWVLCGFVAWIYAYKNRQFLEEREFAVIPIYLCGGLLNYLCLVLYWIKTNGGDKLFRNPFYDFSLTKDKTFDA